MHVAYLSRSSLAKFNENTNRSHKLDLNKFDRPDLDGQKFHQNI